MKRIILIFSSILFLLSSCRKFIEVPSPKTEVDIKTVFSDDINAKAAISAIYMLQMYSGYQISMYAGHSSDEFYSAEQGRIEFVQNGLLPSNPVINTFWQDGYRYIYMANAVIEGIANSSNVSEPMKEQLTGEAKFIRAFNHFYLTVMFGEVPIVATTDYEVNNTVKRMPVVSVYDAVISDLLDAQTLLADNYPSEGRVRVNKAAATALLARVYLYTNDWAKAEAQATAVINQTGRYELLDDLDMIFKKNSGETILQMMPPSYQNWTPDGQSFVNKQYPGNGYLTDALIDAFEPGDMRKVKWTGTGTDGTITWLHPYKYKENQSVATGAEYTMFLRLGEQYLIRAEARARQGNLTGAGSAASDIDSIRVRAGLLPTTASTETELLAAITQERRVELFMEWGDRWFDLKRKKEADAVFSIVKTGWSANDTLYPIPISEILANPRITQNEGYR